MPLTERQAAFWAEYCRICRQSGDTFDPVPDPTKIISPAPDQLRAKIDARNRESMPPAPVPQVAKPVVAAPARPVGPTKPA